ncbi:MAG: hypothetical protein M3P85_07065 [Actinomycetota bacterium]|nr:hypothetical protein [Actinomycetota bacterium]PLS76292.1 MAG: hypothetical protein CYG61_02845 [Actinomycetota bacterium]
MTIEKGKPWGGPGALPADGVVVRSDAEARAVLEEARRQQRPFPALGLLGGDLWHTLGGTGDEARLRSPEAATFPVDLGEALVDGRLSFFVAHLVAHNRLWSRGFVAMNAQWRGAWNLGPRAHPGDALLDTYDVRLRHGDLSKVRARLHHGTHLPHPRIKERRAAAVQVELDRALPIELDGERIGAGRMLSVRVHPDALRVVV